MQSTVLHAANRHAQLSSSLSALDHASSELTQLKSYIQDLERDSVETEKLLKTLERKTSAERKEHESLRDSVTRRLTYKLTGRREKFEKMAEKEEREYVDALQEEINMRSRRDTCQQMIQEAYAKKSRLESELTQYESIQQQLDSLYESVFSGPTPEHPEEDEAEQLVEQAKSTFNDLNGRLNTETRARQILDSAAQSLGRALALTSEALDASQMDVWGFGGSFADYIERSALAQAQAQVSNAQMLIRQAQQVQPLIQPIPPISLPQGNLWSDLVFDNYFTDRAFHHKIQLAYGQILQAVRQIKGQEAQAIGRTQALQRQLKDAKEGLDRARKELFNIRQAAFERTLENARNPPPTYEQQAADPPPEFPTS